MASGCMCWVAITTVGLWRMQFKHVLGQLTALLRVALEPSLDLTLRQVAAITFKNLVKTDWDRQGLHQLLCVASHVC